MQIIKDMRRVKRVGKRVLRGRKSYKEVTRILRTRPALEEQHFRIGVYFADSDVNIYQMRQWYAPLKELSADYPVLLIARNAIGARAMLAESGLPVAYAPKVQNLEQLIATQPLEIIFYVNQNAKNFQMLRYGRRWHVFINHGESDKMYMTTNQHKCYDFAFVAGQAARNRLSKALWDYDVESRTFEIGRPQTDHLAGKSPYEPDERVTVLYAPTWEGDRPTAAYGSIASHGEQLVAALIATGKHRVIYRPHPRSGVLDSGYAAANARIKQALKAANDADPAAQHVIDTAPTLSWQLAATDVAICDISAMIYDRLATGKPLLVTRPVAASAEVDKNGYLGECEWLEAAAAGEVAARVQTLVTDPDVAARNQRWVTHYFGDTAKGQPTARFRAAVAELLQRGVARSAAQQQ